MYREPVSATKSEVSSKKWHPIRQRFLFLFNDDFVEIVENWYNVCASRTSRDSFQRCMKSILSLKVDPVRSASLPPLSSSAAASKPVHDALAKHRANYFSNLYGVILSAAGHQRLFSWALDAPESLLDDVRVSFSAIMGTLNPKSVTKEDFVPKEIDTSVSKAWHRKRVDWLSKKNHDKVQKEMFNPMEGTSENPLRDLRRRDPHKEERFIKPKSQFDGDAVLRSLGLDGADALEKLKEKREEALNSRVSSVDAKGCKVYQRKTNGENRGQESSRERIIATFTAPNASGWETTTREAIRDHSGSNLAKPLRVTSETHPSMSRITASLGMVVPHPSLAPK